MVLMHSLMWNKSELCKSFLGLITRSSLQSLYALKTSKTDKKSQKSGKSDFTISRKKRSCCGTKQDREISFDTFLPNDSLLMESEKK